MAKHPCVSVERAIEIKNHNIPTKTQQEAITLGGNNLVWFTMKFPRTKENKKLDLKTMPALLFCENSFVSSPHLNHSIWQSPPSSDRIPPVLLQPINPLCPISLRVSGLHQAAISYPCTHTQRGSLLCNQQSNTGSKGCTLMVKKKQIQPSQKYKHNPSQKNQTIMFVLVMKQEEIGASHRARSG